MLTGKYFSLDKCLPASIAGDGNRVSETVGGSTTKFLVDDHNPTGLPQVLDEIVSGSVTRTYAYGLQRISENQPHTRQTCGFWRLLPTLTPHEF